MQVSDSNESLARQLKTATELLEKAAIDRAALDKLSDEDRSRLFAAAERLFYPDATLRRRQVKAKARARKAEQAERLQPQLDQTGIRALRREKVFMTPNVFPPENFQQQEVV